mmetsp:Transcript_10709/g.17955  ORF Transcript_10709/g.17955 Transcript_10709/m.17955 type:complete len:447 (+) Transcript_10709:43-1383(+)|eukprot:CAMPEP_0119319486 /NCGR_PEP_ID=MMETSP1333-20130426/49540_1 /TAXON_ID=418940 /ORGANISM="Scyphosphaera apsteinii, Strain RCC1455" /LENGTH=446 /DNA_ID=CAMNT_0007325907 /DNA_START=34 /DNA_END=1374 /DNA_ORIENTATION=+
MANSTHCPISLCETKPGACETALAGAEWVALLFITLTPIFMSVALPLLLRRFLQPTRLQDDDATGDFEVARASINPPMYMCGIGCIPYDCGDSGLLTIIFVFTSAFVVVFIGVLQGEHPCDSGLGGCRTISCFCGNAISQGYAFMFGSLLLTCFMLVQRFTRMPHRHRAHHKWIKATLIVGSLMLSFTGTFPEKYDRNSTMASWGLYALHLLGVFGSGLLLLGLPFGWFFEHFWTHRDEVSLFSVGARSVHVLLTLTYGTSMQLFGLEVEDQTVNFCHYMKDQESCDDWPRLQNSTCSNLLSCVHRSKSDCELPSAYTNNHTLLQPNYRCRFLSADIDASTAVLAPAAYLQATAPYGFNSCIKSECPLFTYARTVALEFGTLLLILTYVASFALHDCARLLGRAASANPLLTLNAPLPIRTCDDSGLMPRAPESAATHGARTPKET